MMILKTNVFQYLSEVISILKQQVRAFRQNDRKKTYATNLKHGCVANLAVFLYILFYAIGNISEMVTGALIKL